VTKDPKVVSIVVRVHNDETRVASFLRTIDAYFADRFANYEFVVADDQSTDRTADVVAEVATELHGSLTLLRLANRHGRELAMVAALERAMGDFLFEMEDVHIDYPLEVLGRIYDTALSGYDIVGATPERLPLRLRAFYWVCNRFSAYEPGLTYEHVRVVSRRAVDAMVQLRERVRYRQVLYRFTGYRQTRVTYKFTGRWRFAGRDSLSFALDVLLSFTDAGVRTAHALSLLFLLGAAGGVVWAVLRSILSESVPAWWMDVGIMMALGFGGVFVLLGIIGEYLARILAEVRSRPLYTLDKTRSLVVTPTESARTPVEVPAEDRTTEPVGEPMMVVQRQAALHDRQIAEGKRLAQDV
jgi:glycosyltransferase involved in cell wall biosynthesis